MGGGISPPIKKGVTMKKIGLNEQYNNDQIDTNEFLDHVFALYEHIKDVRVDDYKSDVVKAAYFFHTKYDFPIDALPNNVFDLVNEKLLEDAEDAFASSKAEDYYG